MRRAVVLIAAFWLSTQVIAVMMTPVILVMISGAGPAACVCVHGSETSCPMHQPPSGAPNCLLRRANDQPPGLLTALFTGVGLMPGSMAFAHLAALDPVIIADPSVPASRPIAPESPPPRA